MKKPLLVVCVGIAAVCIYILSQSYESADTLVSGVSSLAKKAETAESTPQEVSGELAKSTQNTLSATNKALHTDPLFNALRNRLTLDPSLLDDALWQFQNLDTLRAFFREQYPHNWEAEMLAFLRFAFPDRAEHLVNRFYALVDYEQWQADTNDVRYNSTNEKHNVRWEKRYELFGDDANQIWKYELQAKKISEGMQQLAQQSGDFSQQKQSYISLLKDVYGQSTNAQKQSQSTNQAIEFLSLENVQANLGQMPVNERRTALRGLRRDLGMSESAIARLELLDEERDVEHSKGQLYESRREQLIQSYAEDELQDQLKSLRIEIFGESEADYLAREEESGFYRFREQKKYGIN